MCLQKVRKKGKQTGQNDSSFGKTVVNGYINISFKEIYGAELTITADNSVYENNTDTVPSDIGARQCFTYFSLQA